MRLTKSHLKEVAWIATGQIATVAGGIVGIKVLTNLLAPEQYGTFALALTLATLSQQVWAGPLQQAVNRHVAPYLQTGHLPQLIATGAFVFLRIALAQAILLFCVIATTAFIFHLDKDIVFSLLLGVLLAGVQPAFELPQGIYVQLRKRKNVAIYQGLIAISRPLLAAVLVLSLGAHAAWAMLGALIATIVLATVQGKNMVALGRDGAHSKELGWELVRFATPYLTWGTLSWGVTAGDRWILGLTSTTEIVGLYVVAFQVSTIIPRVVSQLVSGFLVPILNEMVGTGKELSKVRKTVFINSAVVLGIGMVGIIGALGASIFGHEIVALLTGPGYDVIAYTLPWLFAGSAMYEMANLCFGVGPLLFRPKYFVRPRVAAYGITLCLMVLLAIRWKLEGMVAAYFIGAFIQLLVTAITAKKLYKEESLAIGEQNSTG